MLHYTFPRAVTGATPAVGSSISHSRSAVDSLPDARAEARRVVVADADFASAVAAATSQLGGGTHDAKPWYRREVWLVLGLGAFVPVTLAIFVPQEWKVPLLGLTGVMIAASAVLLIRQQGGIRPGDDRGAAADFE